MKRLSLSVVILGLTVAPALAGGMGGDIGSGAVLLRAVTRLAEKLISMF